MCSVGVGGLQDSWDCFVHANCQCNELVSLANRVLFKVPLVPKPEVVKLAKQMAVHYARLLAGSRGKGGFTRSGYEACVAAMPRAKREKYLRYKPECEMGIKKSASNIQAFLKYERIRDPDKDPRMIQFRGPAYGLELKSWLHGLEHRLYSMKGDGKRFPETRMIAKGLNSTARCQLLEKKLTRFTDWVILSIDAKRWDAHVTPEQLRIEHSVYNYCYNDPSLAALLEKQVHNKGFTSTGLKYSLKGGRMSGDMNTALGNCMLMVIFVSTALDGLKWDCLDDGDDCLIIVQRGDEVEATRRISQTFEGLGHEIKFENRATTLEQVLFCQSMPVWDGTHYKFVRNHKKICGFGLNGSQFTRASGRGLQKYIKAVGLCELALNVGIPIVQAYAERLIQLGGDVVVPVKFFEHMGHARAFVALAKNEAHTGYDGLSRIAARSVTVESRMSFWRAYGVTPGEQEILEREIGQMEMPVVDPEVSYDMRR
jgi:hypothetical protein